MSNIDNYVADCSSNRDNRDERKLYQRKEDYTLKVKEFVKAYDDIIPFIIKEFDDINEKAKSKPCKAFNEKRAGLQALKKFHDQEAFQDIFYWYITEPNKNN